MKRILVADDHEAVRSGLRAVLEARSGWEVVAEAHDGRQALAAAIETRPDVAIVDYSMPFMTGIEVTRHIRERQLAAAVLIEAGLVCFCGVLGGAFCHGAFLFLTSVMRTIAN